MARRPSIWKTNPEYAKARKRLQNQLSRIRKKGIQVDVQVPHIPKKITEASVRALQRAQESATRKYKKAITKATSTAVRTPAPESPKPSYPDYPTETSSYLPDYSDYDDTELPEPIPERYVDEEIPGGTAVVDMSTGEVVMAHVADRPAPTNVALADHILNVYVDSQFFGNWSPTKSALQGFFNRLVSDYGKETVAQALVEAQKDGIEIQRNVMYDDASAEMYMDNILNYIGEVGEETRSQYAEMFSNFEDWNTELDREAFESRYME